MKTPAWIGHFLRGLKVKRKPIGAPWSETGYKCMAVHMARCTDGMGAGYQDTAKWN